MRRQRWFVPRAIGIGWRPAAWPGWAITVVAIGGAVTGMVFFHKTGSPVGIAVFAGVLALYVAVGGLLSRLAASSTAVSEPAAQPITAEIAAAVAPGAAATPARVVRASDTRSTRAAALRVEGLSKHFGERVAFQDVSFEVGTGEVFGFLGPNGAGKTTTVRTLGTLIAPSAGSAMVAGIPLTRANGQAIRQRIAIMPEAPGLYLRLSVRENLEYFAGLFTVSDPAKRIHRALQAVGLESRAGDLCSSLSKGLRQRVGLARALLSEPDVLFLDEPTSGLDPVATREVHELIDGLRKQGVTVFLTTHRLEEAERLCDRVAILNTTLRMVGRPDELRARLFTRSLVVMTAAPLEAPDRVFGGVSGVDRWERDDSGRYVLTVSDPTTVAPLVTRALVAVGADVISIAESQHSLEDVYLELVATDVEAAAAR